MVDRETFLQNDYNQKTQYLTQHFSRMWTRFNFFITIETALFTLTFKSDYQSHVWLLILTGLVLAGVWYYFGATDNYLADHYRNQVSHTFFLLRKSFETCLTTLEPRLEECADNDKSKGYYPVGDTKQRRFLNPATDTFDVIRSGPLRFRSANLSATELSVVLPFIFILAWVIRGVVQTECRAVFGF